MQELFPMIAMSYSSLLKHSCEEKKIYKKVGNMYIVIDCLVGNMYIVIDCLVGNMYILIDCLVGNMYILIDCLVTGSVTILQVCDTIGDGPFY